MSDAVEPTIRLYMREREREIESERARQRDRESRSERRRRKREKREEGRRGRQLACRVSSMLTYAAYADVC